MILLDEIEKAHPDVFNILLQVLDEGHLTDNYGRVIDFKNTVVIMTSNVGARDLTKTKSLGFTSGDAAQNWERRAEKVRDELKNVFNPEFLNRLDDVIVFHALSEEQLLDITRLLLDRLVRRLHAQRIDLEFTDEAVRFLAQEGYDPEYGARPLRRTITRLVENELSRLVLGGSVEPGDRVKVEVEDGDLRFDVERGAFEQTSKARESVGAGVSE